MALDPSEPVANAASVTTLLTAYMFYAAAAVWQTWIGRPLPRRLRLTGHAADVVFAVGVLAFTEAANSPFFVLVGFPLLSATLRWQSRGAIWTGISVIAAFTGLGLCTAALGIGGPFEPNAFIIRTI